MEKILEQYYELQSEADLKAPAQPNEYADLQAAMDHVSKLLSDRRLELTSSNRTIEIAARKNNLGIINVLVVKRLALATVVDAVEHMHTEMSNRMQVLTRRIELTTQQLQRLYDAARRDVQALTQHKEHVAVSESWLVYLQAQHIDMEGRTYHGEKLIQKIAEEQFHHLKRYDECEAAKQQVQKHLDKAETFRSELLDLGYPLDDDFYERLRELLESPLYGNATLQLVNTRQEQQDRASQHQARADWHQARAIARTIEEKEEHNRDPRVVEEREAEERLRARRAEIAAQQAPYIALQNQRYSSIEGK